MTNLHDLANVWVTAAIGVLGTIIVLVVSIRVKLQPVMAVLSAIHRAGTWVWGKFHSQSSTTEKSIEGSTFLNMGSHADVSNSNIGSARRDFIGGNVTTNKYGLTLRQVNALMRRKEPIGNHRSPRKREARPKTLRTSAGLPKSRSISSTFRSLELTSQEQAEARTFEAQHDRVSQRDIDADSITRSESSSSINPQTVNPNRQAEPQCQADSEQRGAGEMLGDASSQASSETVAVEDSPHIEIETGDAVADKTATEAQASEGDQMSTEHSQLGEQLTGPPDDEDQADASQMQRGAGNGAVGVLGSKYSEDKAESHLVTDAAEQAVTHTAADSSDDSALTHTGTDSRVIVEEVHAHNGESATPDGLPLPEVEMSLGDGDVEIPVALPTLLHDEDDERTKGIPQGNAVMDDNGLVILANRDLHPEIQVSLPHDESRAESENLLKQILENFALKVIGFTLKKRRIAVDIRQTDISYDRGWVEALEQGEWESLQYFSDPLLFNKLDRYLYVVGWTVEELDERLISRRPVSIDGNSLTDAMQ